MPRKFIGTVFLFFFSVVTLFAATPYEVEWTTPSADCRGSMPLGNGKIGVNAWVNPVGELEFFISGTDVFDDYGRIVKYGALKIQVDSSRSFTTSSFRQTLDVKRGTMVADFGDQEDSVKVCLWVDAHFPVVVVEIESKKPTSPQAILKLWRDETPEYLDLAEPSDLFWGKQEKRPVFPDFILTEKKIRPGQIGWYHTNRKLNYFDEIGRTQGMTDYPGRRDPFAGRTFGAIVSSPNPIRVRDDLLQSKSGTVHRFEVIPLSVLENETSSYDAWLRGVYAVQDQLSKHSLADRFEKHLQSWSSFWDRSHLLFSTSDEKEKNVVFKMNQAGILQRYINASCGRGDHPIKFNGAIFTVPPVDGQAGYADYRRWGPGYWLQNTRIPYLSMPMSGDFDLMQSFIKTFSDLRPLCEYRTKKYFGLEGSFFNENLYFWGDVFPEAYGFTPWNKRADRLQESPWHKWEWVGGLEIAFMFLNYYEYTGDVDFLLQKAIPMADSVTRFFDGYYKTDPKTGKLIMSPSQALETWRECVNPMPEIAGLIAVLDKVLAIVHETPELTIDREQIERWKTLRKKIPSLPVRTDSNTGKKMLAAADSFAGKFNIENPELYAVYPFRLFSFEKPQVELARNAFEVRGNPGWKGWRQDDLFASYLGMGEFVHKTLLDRTLNKDKNSRFPAFWGPNYDWIPDQCHGGVILELMQSVAMQTDRRKIFVCPSLPKNWNVEFKLHAPYKTVVEVKTEGGKISELKVTPPERKNDVVLCRPEK